ncbi:MAG: hypothetical protein IT317_03565 [Anaerolineales bacterium]|nr:hypothetical protein [Anaerolineales bacterium]
MPAPSRPHRLLLYERLYTLWRGPALLLTLLTAGLSLFAPGPLDTLQIRVALAAMAALALLLYIYAVFAPRQAYVQARPNYLLLSTPFFRLSIAYSRIRTTRPVPFDPGQVGWADGRIVDPFRGRTQLAVDLNHYPINVRWLRFFLMAYLLPRTFLGLQFVVADWMALSRDIEGQRAEWGARQQAKTRPGVYSMTPRRP